MLSPPLLECLHRLSTGFLCFFFLCLFRRCRLLTVVRSRDPPHISHAVLKYRLVRRYFSVTANTSAFHTDERERRKSQSNSIGNGDNATTVFVSVNSASNGEHRHRGEEPTKDGGKKKYRKLFICM